MRGCQPSALGLAVRRDLFPVHLGWIIARVVIRFVRFQIFEFFVLYWIDNICRIFCDVSNSNYFCFFEQNIWREFCSGFM